MRQSGSPESAALYSPTMIPPSPSPRNRPIRRDFANSCRRRLRAFPAAPALACLRAFPTALSLVCLLAVAGAAPLSAQYRFGVSVFGASMAALVGEYRWGDRGVEVQVGTWRLRDVSVSVTAKQYLGSRSVEPFVGLGLWGIVAREEGGTGAGLVARVPVGVGWDFASRHNAAFTIHLNRALAVRRPGAGEGPPLRTSLVPLPEFSYRWQDAN